MESLDVGVKAFVHLYAVGVELELRGVEQRLLGGEAGHDVVHGLDEVDYVEHGAVGHGGGYVARDGIGERRSDVRAVELLLPCALAVENIAVALDENVSRAEHICQLADLLRVFNGLIERLIEVVRAEYGEVCVIALELLVGVSVDDGEIVVVVLLADEAAGILAERANLVLERLGIADELRLVENVVDLLHDLVSYLDAHADIDCAGLMGDIMLSAELFEPVRAAAPCRYYGVLREYLYVLLALADIDALAAVAVEDYIVALVAEKHIDAVFYEILLDGVVDILRLLRAEMAYRAVDKAKTRFYGALSYLLDLLLAADALNMGVCAELEVDAVGIFYCLLSGFIAYELGELTADLGAQRQLAVRERARAGEARGDMTIGLAVDALVCFRFGAAALFDRLTLFDHHYFLVRTLADKLDSREYSGRARADDNYVVFHWYTSFFIREELSLRLFFQRRPCLSREERAGRRARALCRTGTGRAAEPSRKRARIFSDAAG